MAITKLGQLSHNAVNDLQQRHFDANMKMGEIFNDLPLDLKNKVITMMPQFISEIKAEMAQRENDI